MPLVVVLTMSSYGYLRRALVVVVGVVPTARSARPDEVLAWTLSPPTPSDIHGAAVHCGQWCAVIFFTCTRSSCTFFNMTTCLLVKPNFAIFSRCIRRSSACVSLSAAWAGASDYYPSVCPYTDVLLFYAACKTIGSFLDNRRALLHELVPQ